MQDNLTSPSSSPTPDGVAKPSSRQKASSPAAQSKPTGKAARSTSKQTKVLDLLRRKEGASIAAIMKATGWQRHSVHGFLAGVVRRKLKLNLVRSGEAEKAVYRITPGNPQKSRARSGRPVPARKPAKRTISKRSR
jgi:hypothetical protein